MGKIEEVLEKYGKKVADLSDTIQEQIAALDTTISGYNQTLSAYNSTNEKDEEIEEELRNMQGYIDNNEELISQEIETELGKPADAPIETPVENEEEGKGVGVLGWILGIGAAVLGINYLRNKNK